MALPRRAPHGAGASPAGLRARRARSRSSAASPRSRRSVAPPPGSSPSQTARGRASRPGAAPRAGGPAARRRSPRSASLSPPLRSRRSVALVTSTGRAHGRDEGRGRRRGPSARSDLADLVVPPSSDATRRPGAGRGGYLVTLALAPFPFVLAGAAGAGFASRPRLLAALLALAAVGVVLALGARGGVVPLLWDAGLARGVRFPARWFVLAHFAPRGGRRRRPGRLARRASPRVAGPRRARRRAAPQGRAPRFGRSRGRRPRPPPRVRRLGAPGARARRLAGLRGGSCWRRSPGSRPLRPSALPASSAGALLVVCVGLPLPLGARDRRRGRSRGRARTDSARRRRSRPGLRGPHLPGRLGRDAPSSVARRGRVDRGKRRSAGTRR